MNADFKKYDYFYNGWVARLNKKNGKSELFVNGTWKPAKFANGLNLLAGAGSSDVVKLDATSSKFLQELLDKKIKDSNTL